MTIVPPVLDALSLNRYHLKIKGCTAPLDVESFQGREGLSTRYRYEVVFTSAEKDIDPAMMLMKNVTFIMQTLPQAAFRRTIAPEVQRTLYGVVTCFSRLSVSADEATYSLTFEPRLSLLDNSRRSAIYQNLSVPGVVEKILRENHNWPGWLFEFRLSATYPPREIITQFMLSDAEFIARLLSEVGIWFNFIQNSETRHEVVLFGDSARSWQYDVSVPAVSPAGMHDIAVTETLSLFAKQLGIRLFAAAGKVEIQAQSDALDLLAMKDMQISSQNGKVTVSAQTELLLQCGGAWIQMKGGSITLGGSGNVTVRAGTLEKLGAASMQGSISLPDGCSTMKAPKDAAEPL